MGFICIYIVERLNGVLFLFMVNICTVTLLKNKRQMILFVKTHITLFTTEPFNNLLVFCLFVCLFGGFSSLENFLLVWRRHHCRWRASNFDWSSALMAIEQWGFFSVSHLLWHGASVHKSYLRGLVSLTPIAERSAVELSLPVFTTWAGIRTPNLKHARLTL